MAIVSKDLGTVIVASGTLSVELFYDDTVIANAAHIPSANECLLSIGTVTEGWEKKAGIFRIGDMTFAIREDYTNYVAGVWYKLFTQSDVRFHFYLDEGAGNTYLFAGYVDAEKTKFPENHVSNPGASGRYIRVARVNVVSLFKRLQETSIADVVTKILANDYVAGDSISYITYKKLFGSILEAAFGSSLVDLSTSVIFPSGDNDIQFGYSGTWYNIDGLSVQTYDGITLELSKYLDDTDATYYWGVRFGNALELLSHLLKQFGYCARIFYGQSDETVDASGNLFYLKLMQRGRVGNVVTFAENEKTSQIATDNSVKARSVRVETRVGVLGLTTSDVKVVLDHLYMNPSFYTLDRWEKIFHGTTSFNEVGDVRYYDYISGAFVSGLSLSTLKSLGAVSFYYTNRWGKSAKSYQRTYKSLKGTDSTTTHLHCTPYRRTEIHDGVSNGTYYANKVVKSIDKNELKIDWIEQ